MTKDEIKDQVQRKGLNKWYQQGCKGLLEYATGSGKTRCGVLAAEYVVEQNPDANILILSPMEDIRDVVWPEEFRKWGCQRIFDNNITSECIQTAYKWSDQHYDLVIADEYDSLVTEEFAKFFTNNTYDKLLALSAYVPEDKEEYTSITGAYPIERISLREAKRLGLISEYIEFAVPVPMTTKEARSYRDLEDKYNKYAESLGGRRNAYKTAAKIMRNYKGKRTSHIQDQQIREAVSNARNYWKTMTKRMHLINRMQSKVSATSSVLDMDVIDSSVVFFKTTKIADHLALSRQDSISYHSNGDPKKGSPHKNNLEAWKAGSYDHLITCEKINRGVNIPKVNYAIIAGTNSSKRDRIQRTGRVLRNEESDLSYVIDLYYPNSQDEEWLKRSLGSDVDRVHWLSGLDDLKARLNK